MGGKGQTKQKRLSKLTLKKTTTITEMFKKQSENKQKLSEKDNRGGSIEDDDDVIFIEESATSPYFSKTEASPKVTKTSCTSGSPVPPRVTKTSCTSGSPVPPRVTKTSCTSGSPVPPRVTKTSCSSGSPVPPRVTKTSCTSGSPVPPRVTKTSFTSGSPVPPRVTKTSFTSGSPVPPRVTKTSFTSGSPVPTRVRKRKLSLVKVESNSCHEQSVHNAVFNNGESVHSSNVSIVNCDNIVTTSSTNKLEVSEKPDTGTDVKQFIFKTRAGYKQKNVETSSSIKKQSKLSSKANGKVNCNIMHLSDSSSTTGATETLVNLSNEADQGLKQTSVHSTHSGLTEMKSTTNQVNSKFHSPQIDTDGPGLERGSENDGSKNIELPVADNGDSNNVNGDDSSAGESQFRVPYYLNSFETILKTVMEDESNKKLFNSDDMCSVTTYQQLSDAAKKLYIRMFSRKLRWIPLSKLKYSEIGEDLKPYLQELAEAALIYCDDHLTDLEEVLNALSASDIKTLAKFYHMTSHISQKKQLVQELLKKSQQSTLSTMFKYTGDNVAKTMLVRAKKYLNGIYRLRDGPRGVFVRVMMLFSLVSTLVDEESGTGGQGQLFQMLMVNMGKLVYPTYTIDKVHCVFQDREDLIRFESALQLESDLLHCIERGDWDKAYNVFTCIRQEWDHLQEEESNTEWSKNLPAFLRCFTATSVVHRLLSSSVEILQRRKDYTGAVELLRKLLAESAYNQSHRGYLWERLALNLDAHLKQPLQSLEAVQSGLEDSSVRVGHRLALYQRAESICQKPRLKLQSRLKEFYHDAVRETPKVYIEGRVLHQDVNTNGTRFLADELCTGDSSEDMTVMGVEEYVLHYYKKNGFPSGTHAEGSIVSTLFALFFWDILFMSLPDAFHSPFQALPLDLHSSLFYERRKSFIEKRLAQLRDSSVQELQTRAEETWTSQQGVLCAGLNWDLLSLSSIKELLQCMGGEVLSGLVGRLARCPRHTRSGFPDLTLWNAATGALKICEVKGPGDKLSHKQILWIDYLVSLGVDAEVCHVKAVAAKKLRPVQQ